MRMKEESEKAGLKLNIQKTKIIASNPIASRQIEGENVEAVIDFIFLCSKITADGDCSHEIKRHSFIVKKAMTSLQFSSVAGLCPTLCNPMNRSTPGLPVHHHLPEFTQTHVHRVGMPSSHLILCRPLLLLPPIPPSIRVFSNESTLHMKWPKFWSSSFSIIPSKEIPGLISFRMDWLDLLAVQGTLKSLLQHHSSKASILRRSAFFTVQLSHPYMTTGKTVALTRRSYVGKVMSLLLNMLSRLVITFLPRSKRPTRQSQWEN